MSVMQESIGRSKDYQLSSSARAAIISGDLDWIRKNVGELTKEQLQLIISRLEREV